MAWTAPSTFVAGAILTAAQLNTNVRDNTLAGGPIYATTAARDAAIPTPFAGQRAFVSGTNVNYQYNGTAWVSPQALSVPPMCLVTRTATQAITNATDTLIAFTAGATFDTEPTPMFSAGLNTTITIRTTGVYIVSFQINWASNATGVRYANVRIGGGATSAPAAEINAGGAANHAINGTIPILLTATNALTLNVYQSSGGALNVNSAQMSATFIGKTA